MRGCVDEVSMLKNDNWLLNETDRDLKDIFWISSFGGLNNFQTSRSYAHLDDLPDANFIGSWTAKILPWDKNKHVLWKE